MTAEVVLERHERCCVNFWQLLQLEYMLRWQIHDVNWVLIRSIGGPGQVSIAEDCHSMLRSELIWDWNHDAKDYEKTSMSLLFSIKLSTIMKVAGCNR